MISVASLRSIYQGRPAAVLGGGPSLRADLQLLSSGTVGFSVNQHALRFCEPAFLVFMDKLSDVSELAAAVASFKGLKVSQITGQGDIDLSGVPYWDGGFSAAWPPGWLVTWTVTQCCCAEWIATKVKRNIVMTTHWTIPA